MEDSMTHYIIEYVWIGGNNELRSKIKIIHSSSGLKKIPDWNFDGSSTNQAKGNDSEVIIKPRATFYGASNNKNCVHIYALCDTYVKNLPHPTNNRQVANAIFNSDLKQEPWFGLEQEYFIIKKDGKPLGYEYSTEQGQYYCSVGYENAYGRKIAEEHMNMCIEVGIKISGINAEVAPGQWEFQVGPCIGIEAGDHLWMARYLLCKIAEKHKCSINFEPKPLKGDWNGSGCHTNYSTKLMREGSGDNNGLYYIDQAIVKLSYKHDEHMAVYGNNNEQRMTGAHETASFNKFTSGIADRGASIRIGNENYNNKCGYFEDRRPSSNCDPYLVTSKLFHTTCL